MTYPLISIILPTYNGKSEWLVESINSVLIQTYNNFELIIINDASTNDIENSILEFVGKDKRIIYYRNESNLQLTRTLNK
jgi:glycosyltransferase involved in cell wall biosynthesis